MSTWNDTVIDQFRAGRERVADTFDRDALVLLHSTGARTGEPRVSPVARFRLDGRTVVIASKAGADTHPAWLHNLRAHPQARIEVWEGDQLQVRDVVATVADPQERDRIWPLVTGVAPGFAEYQTKTDRQIPVVFLDPA
jgi:deazaflavin-dependent oxidoreductase (nitroreductase family)